MFLGLVRYILNFLPCLATHTSILTPLTTKDSNKVFPEWNDRHLQAFDAIKQLVISRECLTVIDYKNLGGKRVFVTTDASEFGLGAMLSVGKNWQDARPVTFESIQLKPAQLNYPIHEKELLALIHALSKWRVELLGMPFTINVLTDHKTLTSFLTQCNLSHCCSTPEHHTLQSSPKLSLQSYVVPFNSLYLAHFSPVSFDIFASARSSREAILLYATTVCSARLSRLITRLL